MSGPVRKRLDEMVPGEAGVVISIELGQGRGGCRWGVRSRLEAMGLRAGVRIRVVSAQPMRGPVVVDVAGVRLALGRGMARNVVVDVQELRQKQ